MSLGFDPLYFGDVGIAPDPIILKGEALYGMPTAGNLVE